ncbi:MAG TPA: hypothetical protein EYH58_02530 [Aquifex aeolicus]|nr:hypothetical protein [Aquifex aeolicus]
MKYEIICPQNVDFKSLHDFRVCRLDERPVYLKLYGAKAIPEFFVKLVYENSNFSLYRTTFGKLQLFFKLILEGKIKLIRLEPCKKKPEKRITLKQRTLLLKLMEELNVNYSIPDNRYEASKLISKLLRIKKQKKVAV